MSARKTPRYRPRKAPSLATLRSAVTNGTQLLAGCDHRAAHMRRLRDLIAAHVSDLGGADALSSAELILVRKASMLCLQTEMMETRWAGNEGEASPRQIETYQRACNTLRRLLESLGLKRRARDITPDPLTYAARYDEQLDKAQP